MSFSWVKDGSDVVAFYIPNKITLSRYVFHVDFFKQKIYNLQKSAGKSIFLVKLSLVDIKCTFVHIYYLREYLREFD